jgi:hypothetical protein
MNKYTEKDLDFILSPLAIRQSAEAIFELTKNGKTHFRYHPEKFDEVVDFVIEVIKENYPTLKVPFHSRWGHFKPGGIDRVAQFLEPKIKNLDSFEKARVKLDLVITSVLLDAGAGVDWKYVEKNSEKTFNRSEGLGVASFYLFTEGNLSEVGSLKATATGLQSLTLEKLNSAFQVSSNNPLIGTEGRLSLLKNLGKTIALKKDIFPGERPGGIVDYLKNRYGMTFTGTQLLRAVLDGLGEIWPGRINLSGVNLGDVWSYDLVPGGMAAFHKLSQWMTYSLCEPLEEAGFIITEIDQLTGLAEYRNGGLLVDKGLISLHDHRLASVSHKPGSEFIIEWRGLTIALLDRIGDAILNKLNLTKDEFPLAKVLEGGTWWAGRKAARAKRSDSSPPFQIESDGTVF